MPLIVPESVELSAARQIDAEYNAQVDAKIAAVKHWDAELKRIDPSLALVLPRPNAIDLKPGIWHVMKEIPGSVSEFWPLEGPNGEYREPGSWILDLWQDSDLWNPRVHRSKQEAKEKLREARQRAKRLEREQRGDEYRLSLSALGRVRDDRGVDHSSQAKREGKGLRSSKKGSRKT